MPDTYSLAAASVVKNGKVYAEGSISSDEGADATYNYFEKYEILLKAEETVMAGNSYLNYLRPVWQNVSISIRQTG